MRRRTLVTFVSGMIVWLAVVASMAVFGVL